MDALTRQLDGVKRTLDSTAEMSTYVIKEDTRLKISVKEEVTSQFAKVLADAGHVTGSELGKLRNGLDALKNFKYMLDIVLGRQDESSTVEA